MAKKNENKKMKKKKGAKRWGIRALAIVVILAGLTGGNTETKDAGVESSAAISQETGVPVAEEISVDVKTACRALTMSFVKDVLQEKYSMSAFSIESFELNEDRDGRIDVLYMPDNAGGGATKVNLTIEKSGNTYTIENILLAGIDEVDMDTIPNRYKVLVY